MADPLPLQGVRVLDLTTMWAGPIAGMFLADLGAEVIKIESVQRLDNWRAILADPDAPQPYETSPCFNAVQRNKLGITLNLAAADGRRAFLDLVRDSDLVLDNYSPRVMPQFGLDWETLRATNRRVSWVSFTGFGSHGPWKDYISYAQVAESLSGYASLNGEAGEAPLITGQMVADSLAGAHAATAAVLALAHRDRTGEGMRVDGSQLESMIVAVADVILAAQLDGAPPGRDGTDDASAAPYGVFPAAGDDQWVTIAVRTDAQWEGLVRAMGDPGWVRAAELATGLRRWRRRGDINTRVAEWTGPRDKHELVRQLRRAGVSAALVLTPPELLADAALASSGFWQRVDRAFVGAHPYPSAGITLDGRQLPIRRPAPTVGEHTGRVLRELVGYTDARIAALWEADIVGVTPVAAR